MPDPHGYVHAFVDQVPDVARVVLHGVGEPMLVKSLPRSQVHVIADRVPVD